MKRNTFLLMIPFAVMLSSCVTVEPPTETAYLSSYKGLERESKFKGALVYHGDLHKMGGYEKVYIEDVPIQGEIEDEHSARDERSRRKRASQEDAVMLSSAFENSLKKEFGTTLTVVERPERGSLTIRAAVVKATPNSPLLFAAGYAPYASAVSTGIGLVRGQIPGSGSVKIQAEIVDSVTKERFLAFVDEDRTGKTELLGGLSRWGRAKGAFRMWSKKFHRTMKKASRDRSPK